MRVGASKSDQLRHGEIVGAVRNANPLLFAAAGLLRWRHALAGLLGRVRARDEPVLVALDGALQHLEALTRDGAAHAVRRAASAARLVGNYASHSAPDDWFTVAAILQPHTVDEHEQPVRQWAHQVWLAWSQHHPQIRQWNNQALGEYRSRRPAGVRLRTLFTRRQRSRRSVDELLLARG